jgi:hypothetical protein
MVREGTLDSIMLEPSDEQGVPHLRLSISTPVLDNARGTIVNTLPKAEVASKVLAMPLAAQASTVIDPNLVTTPPSGLFTFGAPKADEPAPARRTREVVPVEPRPLSPLALWKSKAAGARRASLSWVVGGWRPLVLGCLAGAVVVSLLWSLF